MEEADKKLQPDSYSSSIAPSDRKVISWNEDDPENPYNWSKVGNITVASRSRSRTDVPVRDGKLTSFVSVCS